MYRRGGDGVGVNFLSVIEVVQQGVAQTKCSSKRLWLNKLVLLIRTSDPCAPPNMEENLCDWGDHVWRSRKMPPR